MGWAAAALALGLFLSGCGTPGAPQPPSLNLPDTEADLSAVRAGNQVTLTWTMPKRNTDRTMIRGEVPVRVCRRESDAGVCEQAGSEQMTSPGGAGTFADALPAGLASGSPRPISYFVVLRNKKGRSAGLSNAAVVLAGTAPAQVEGLRTEVRKDGVVLSWNASGESTAVRLERKLLSPASKTEHGPLAPVPEAQMQNLLVEAGSEQVHAIDKTTRRGESYEYRAQRVAQVEVNGKKLELDGAFSSPVKVAVEDVFPPKAPIGLVAVASAGDKGSLPAIDLSWQPDTDSDVAGYIVYRREDDGEWRRVSAGAPIVEPAFQDPQVQAGHTYQYAVSAADKGGQD